MSKPKACGYIRVSSRSQAQDGESLDTQKAAIEDYCKVHDLNLLKVYADRGISGKSIDKRIELQNLLGDARNSMFDVCAVHRLSRFGRNARDLLNNVDTLKSCNVKFISIKENMDFSTPYGKAMLTMLAAIAQLEQEIIGEQANENKLARIKGNIPSVGNLPFARTYDKKSETWTLDEGKADLIRWAAREYLNGRGFSNIAGEMANKGLKMTPMNLYRTLSERCGDKWIVNFKGEEKPLEIDMPAILGKGTIVAIKERLAFNKCWNRTDAKQYLLQGFIYCDEGRHALHGQTQRGRWTYYRHNDYSKGCKSFSAIRADVIENAVFRTIFENVRDEAGFEKAIAESLPDDKMIMSLQKDIAKDEGALKRIDRELEKLVNLALKGTLKQETIQKKESDLYKAKEEITDRLEKQRQKLKSLPDADEIRGDAEKIRYALSDYFQSEEHLERMSFDEKRTLLHYLFDGHDEEGGKLGIYVRPLGDGRWDYFINARLFAGSRTLKGAEIDLDEYHTCKEGSDP